MNQIQELREKRAKAWDAAKAFLDTKRGTDGMLAAEDVTTYEKMEADVVNLGKEIDRLERQVALDAELNKPTADPLTSKPAQSTAEKKYFSLFLLIASAILFSLLSGNNISATILQYAAVVLLVLSYFRAFSRNLVKRRNENSQYLKTVYPISNWFRSKRHRLEMRKNYKFFTCPDCKTTLRVPRGKGRINLTCPRCHAKFKGRS